MFLRAARFLCGLLLEKELFPAELPNKSMKKNTRTQGDTSSNYCLLYHFFFFFFFLYFFAPDPIELSSDDQKTRDE
jgi:hypothetical protein